MGKGWQVINTNYDVTKIAFELFEIHTPMCFEIIYKLGDIFLTVCLRCFWLVLTLCTLLRLIWATFGPLCYRLVLRHFGLNIFILSSGPFFLWIECLIKYKTWSCQKIYLPIIVST